MSEPIKCIISNPVNYPIEYFSATKYYLPCEITHYTSKLYYSSNKTTFPGVDYIKRYIRPSDQSVFAGIGYYQDSYVQLLNINTEYKNIYNLGLIHRSDIEINMLKCNAPICELIHNRNKRTTQYKQGEIFELKWGQIESNHGSSSSCVLKSQKLIDEFKDDEYVIIDPGKSQGYVEQNKGGNFISAPDGTIFCIEGSSPKFIEQLESDTSTKIVQLKCNFKTGDRLNCKHNCFRHIDEIMCFMPYGNKFKIWFYAELDYESFEKLLEDKYKLIDPPIKNMTDFKSDMINELNIERLANLELICDKLFKKSFSECKKEFVFFKFYSYLPSVLNRTWYETNEKCVCLFPKLPRNRKTDEIMLQLCTEMKKVKSMINQYTKVDYHFIKVNESNERKPEGTLHCLIKQRFIKHLI